MSKTKTPVGLTYVDEFEFPAAQGFTGSRGVQNVKGYMRGGKVSAKGRNKAPTKSKLAKGTKKFGEGGYYGKPGDKYPKSKARQTMPKNVHKKGGKVHAQMGGYVGPERELQVDDVKITVPKARGGKTTSTHDKLVKHGAKMGYAYGGMVKGRKTSIGNKPENIGLKKYKKNPGSQKAKNTSAEFDMKKGKQDTMDTGVQPARRGKNARSAQEAEAGGTGRLKPGLAKGGLARAVLKGVKKAMPRSPDKTKGKGMSRKGVPKTVKGKGGKVGYMRGGKMHYKDGGSC